MEKEQFNNLLVNPGFLNEETLPGLQELTQQFPFFQAAWMLYLKNLKTIGDPAFESVLKKVAVIVPDRKQLYKYLNAKTDEAQINMEFDQSEYKTPVYDLGEEEPVHGNSLIDKFLSSEPSPIRIENKTEELDEDVIDNELVEKSDNEDDELVTETLAMIYFEQKKYDKALDAFKKLSLKYPEKSVYFATRIEEIEKLKNI